MYRYTFTWQDDHPPTVIEAKDQWIAQNKAYVERYGHGNEPEDGSYIDFVESERIEDPCEPGT